METLAEHEMPKPESALRCTESGCFNPRPGSSYKCATHRAQDLGIPSASRKEAVDHPEHYNAGLIETIDAIQAWDLGFSDGNAVKYLSRWRHKHKDPKKQIEDLKKALWYVKNQIKLEEAKLRG